MGPVELATVSFGQRFEITQFNWIDREFLLIANGRKFSSTN